MQFSIEQSNLLKLLKTVSGVIERKNLQQPILANVLVTLEGKKIKLLASDQEIQIQVKGEVLKSQEDGRIAIPFRKLSDWSKSLPDSSVVQFKTTEDKVEVSANKTKIKLSCLPAISFPSFPKIEENVCFSIDSKILKNLMQKTFFAMAEQDVRYYLNSMLLELKPDGITVVASDGHRLVINAQELNLLEVKDPVRAIIPRKSVQEINRILEDKDGEVVLYLSSTQMNIYYAEGSMSMVLFEGKYPDYTRLIPKNLNYTMTVDKDALKEALLRAQALLGSKNKGVLFQLSPNRLVISSVSDNDLGEEELDEVDYSGDKIEIGFNAKYLLDYIHVITDTHLKFFFSSATTSSLINTNQDKNSNYVLMPVQI
ncbi:MAG: DNA polymerase III subunit beta [Gammaproteobacteria bacterium]